MVKYGLDDARPVLERASARETAARGGRGRAGTAAVAQFGIAVGSYVTEIGGVVADLPDLPPDVLWQRAEESDVRCPERGAPQIAYTPRSTGRARQGIRWAACFVVAATGVPVGLGSHVHWERRLDARLAMAVMGIQAIKGVEVGPAFENTRRPAQRSTMPLTPCCREIEGQRGVTRASNRAGGIEGGTSNGQPIVVRAAMKPIPTTISPLRSVDLATGERADTQYQRSDVCAVPAASVVGEAMVAWVLADALLEKAGRGQRG